MEGSGSKSGSVLLTNRPGSGRPRNLRIRNPVLNTNWNPNIIFLHQKYSCYTVAFYPFCLQHPKNTLSLVPALARHIEQITITTQVTNPKKMSAFLKKLTCKGTWGQVFISLRPPGVVKQFCRFGIWSMTQCITPVYALHTTRSPPPPPVTHLHTV